MAHITDGAVKVIEIIGISSKSFEDAVQQALKKASKSVKGISGLEVAKHMATITNDKITTYKVVVKFAFPVL